VIARVGLIALVFAAPAATAADLKISAVVLKSARISVQSPQRIALQTNSAEAVRVTVQQESDGRSRVVFTP